jgi:hypothetical protein
LTLTTLLMAVTGGGSRHPRVQEPLFRVSLTVAEWPVTTVAPKPRAAKSPVFRDLLLRFDVA